MFEELHKDLESLMKELNDDIKNKIRRQHYGDGDLYNSVKLTLIHSTDNDVNYKIEANEYLIYLDDGEFLKSFIRESKPKIDRALIFATKKDIINEFKNLK